MTKSDFSVFSFIHLCNRKHQTVNLICKACRVLKKIRLFQHEVFWKIQWMISSKLGKYYYPHYIKVRANQRNKVTCQRMSELEIRVLAFLASMTTVRQRLSEAKKIPIHSNHFKHLKWWQLSQFFIIIFFHSAHVFELNIVKKKIILQAVWFWHWLIRVDNCRGWKDQDSLHRFARWPGES